MEKKINNEEKRKVLDLFGKLVIENVRDRSLNIAMKIARSETPNPMLQSQFKVLSTLNDNQKEAICDLLSSTITDTIFNFLHMFEDYDDTVKIVINDGSSEYDLKEVCEVLGAEITFSNEDGWIQKFSKIGRFVQ